MRLLLTTFSAAPPLLASANLISLPALSSLTFDLFCPITVLSMKPAPKKKNPFRTGVENHDNNTEISEKTDKNTKNEIIVSLPNVLSKMLCAVPLIATHSTIFISLKPHSMIV